MANLLVYLKLIVNTFDFYRYEQLLLTFSMAFESLEKQITVLEYKTSKKPDEDNE